MKFYRFYLEYPDAKSKRKATVKNPEGHSGNVIAVLLDDNNYPITFWSGGYEATNAADGTKVKLPRQLMYEAIGALMFHPNSVVCGTSASQGYINDCCKRIPEKLAREIHPELFRYLDQ